MVFYGTKLLKISVFMVFCGYIYLEILLFCAFFAQSRRRFGNLKRISLRSPCTTFV